MTGLITVFSVPLVYHYTPNKPSTAPFLTEAERLIALERLRANQANAADDVAEGETGSSLRWMQLCELFLDVKTYLFFLLSVGTNLGADVAVTAQVMKNQGKDDNNKALLQRMPFGAVQLLSCLLVCAVATKVRCKGLTLSLSLVPFVVGSVLQVTTKRRNDNAAVFEAGRDLMAFIFGFNALLLAWMLANTAGLTKKSAFFSLYNVSMSLFRAHVEASTNLAPGSSLFRLPAHWARSSPSYYIPTPWAKSLASRSHWAYPLLSSG